ncbi:MAG: winged helix-turn-helix transcriptional regulator [Zoogloea sp.]|nr:winged helix-turn-helix transcriptional regulator [Zoogloea sp.]
MIDPKRQAELRESIEVFFFAYRAFTTPPDRILAERGLGRVHHRILYFVARSPGIAVNALLGVLDVSKQALHAPLRELVDKGLIAATPAEHDRRVKQLVLTDAGAALEAELSGTQLAMLEKVFADAGLEAEAAWRGLMEQISRSR